MSRFRCTTARCSRAGPRNRCAGCCLWSRCTRPSSDYTAAITQRGAKLKIDYQHMCTEVTAVENASSDAGKKLTYQFNDGGNVVCVRDELGYARFTKYDSAIENTPSDSSRLQKAVVNLLAHPDLRSGWSQLTGASGDSAGPDTATLCLNMATMYLHKAAAGGETKYQQTVTLEGGKDYSLSAYVKTSGVTGTGAFMRIRPVSSSTGALDRHQRNGDGHDGGGDGQRTAHGRLGAAAHGVYHPRYRGNGRVLRGIRARRHGRERVVRRAAAGRRHGGQPCEHPEQRQLQPDLCQRRAGICPATGRWARTRRRRSITA